MGLTRIRAQQISDIDYKQSVRVISKTNITLDGGAPSVVDGVTLVANNRILVAGQTSASQNGIYVVTTVGAGSNGTWTRSADANSAGELEAGMIVTVAEGTVYKDTIWTLITNDPIIIGVTELTFQQSTGFSYGNVYANGTALLANTVNDSLTLAAGTNIAITGNAATKTITIGVTGLSVDTISNGTSNVKVVSSDGNVTVGVNGTGNLAVFSTGGLSVSGNISAGNVLQDGVRVYKYTTGNTAPADPVAGDNWWYTAGNVLYQYINDGSSSQWVDVFDPAFPPSDTAASANTIAQRDGDASLTANLFLGNGVSVSGNVVGGNISIAGSVSAVGNIAGAYILGNGSQLTGLPANYGNTQVADYLPTYTGNLSPGNLTTAGIISASGNVTGGNLTTAGTVTATGNVSGGNVTTAGQVSATGNVTGSNILTNGSISAVGNITGGNLSVTTVSGLLTTAAQTNITSVGTLTNLSVASNISAGNISTTTISGNLTTAAQPNITSVGTLTGLTVNGLSTHVGNIDVTGNINVTGNLNYENVTDLVVGDPLIYIGANNTGNLFDLGMVVSWNDGTYQHGGWVRDASDGTWKLFGNVVAEPTTTVDFANAIYQPMQAGAVTATTGNFSGNINGANLQTTGLVTATGNITGGNLITAGIVTATGNIIGAYFVGDGSQLTGLPATYGNTQVAAYLPTYTGNLSPGNLTSSGIISAVGNITGGNILGNGSFLTGINAYGNIFVSGGSSALAATASDTLTLVAGSGVSITANAAADSITFSVVSSTSIFATGGDMGLTTEAVTTSEDLGPVTSAVSTSYDLGTIAVEGIVTNDSIVDYTITGNKLANNISISTTGNVTAGNVTAGNVITSNVIISNGVYYANGQPYSSGGGGDSVYMAIALG